MSNEALEREIAELKGEIQMMEKVNRQYRERVASLSARLESCQKREREMEAELKECRKSS